MKKVLSEHEIMDLMYKCYDEAYTELNITPEPLTEYNGGLFWMTKPSVTRLAFIKFYNHLNTIS